MAHVQKYSMSAAATLCAHYERGKDPEGNFVLFNNQEIDPLRTYLNYNLATKHTEGQIGFIKKRISEVKIMNRSNVNVMCSWLLTLPKDFSPEDQFFIESYRFMANRYGYENVISAYVHKDERQPHMHFSFVPIKDGKVIAKDVLNRIELSRFHPELKSTLDRIFNRDVAVVTGSTSPVKENDVDRLKTEIEDLLKIKDDLLKEVGDLKKKTTSNEEVEGIEVKIKNNYEDVTYEEYLLLLKEAKHLADTEKKVLSLTKRNEELEELLKQNPSENIINENSIMRTRLSNMENRLAMVIPHVPNDIGRTIRNIINDRDPF